MTEHVKPHLFGSREIPAIMGFIPALGVEAV
jgi:hypothetical protein